MKILVEFFERVLREFEKLFFLMNLQSKASGKFSNSSNQFKSQLQLKIVRGKDSKITINIMKTRSQSAKDSTNGSLKREENNAQDNTSILYVCLTDEKFISKAKASFYVPKPMTSDTNKYPALKEERKENGK